MRYAARSDVGLVRGNNEDSVYAGARLLALADGMGGHAAGEVASQLAIAALAHLDDDEPGGDLLSRLDAAIQEGNAAIAAHIEAEPALEGMGTTLTAILFAGDRLGLVHIGDSRAYLLRDGDLAQITKDDTFVQTLVDEGRITSEEAHSHPQRSLIMRALTGHEAEPALTMREARVGDRYLLCSDGLSDPVSDETILEALRIPEVDDSANRLIELALRSGGPDNVTVVVADVVDHDYEQTQPILAGAVSGESSPLTVPNTAAGRASALNPRRNTTRSAVPHVEAPAHHRSQRRMVMAATLVLLLTVLGFAVGWKVLRTNYYVTAHHDVVSVMRGVQGSVLGVPLHSPYRWACLDTHAELEQVPYGRSGPDPGCHPLMLQDLHPSARTQVASGLPVGTLDEAGNELTELARNSLLPPCSPQTPRPAPRAPQRAPQTTAPTPSSAPAPTPSSTPKGPDKPSTRASPPPATSSSPHMPTVTALPPPPPEPGINCRTVA
jgi:protein phosphatase